MAPPLRSDHALRAAAKAAGLKHYVSDRPCAKGHIGEWKVSSGGCVICARANYSSYRARKLVSLRSSNAEYRRDKLAAKAIAEGRTPHVVGGEKRLTDAQRLENRRANSRSYRVKYPEKAKQLQDAYYASHREETTARVAKRRARKLAVGGTFTADDIRSLYAAQKGKCVLCLKPFGKTKPHVDHYIPLALGGTNDPSNLRLLHAGCNLSKGAKHPIDHGLSRGLLCW